MEEILALRLTQVEGDAALVAADALPCEADAVAAVAPRAHRVTRTRGLDLDDLSAELGEDGTGKRARRKRGRLDDPDPSERSFAHMRSQCPASRATTGANDSTSDCWIVT